MYAIRSYYVATRGEPTLEVCSCGRQVDVGDADLLKTDRYANALDRCGNGVQFGGAARRNVCVGSHVTREYNRLDV